MEEEKQLVSLSLTKTECKYILTSLRLSLGIEFVLQGSHIKADSSALEGLISKVNEVL